MIASDHLWSVDRLQGLRGRWFRLGSAALLLGALAGSLALAQGASPEVPLLMLVAAAVFIILGILWRQPVVSLYSLVFAALFIEQWGIVGLEPLTAQTHFFQSLSGFTPLQLPIMPADFVLVTGLLAVGLGDRARGAPRFYRGALFGPLAFFVAAVIGSFLYGVVGGSGTGPFNPNAAWVEVRAFLQLAGVYLLASSLITDRRRLTIVVWMVIVALGMKGVQGIHNYIMEKELGVYLEAITGHEDVLFFASLFLLLIAMFVYGRNKNQQKAMLWFFWPIAFTMLATGRRIGFLIFALGLLITSLSLFKIRRDLFLKVIPPALILVGVYTGIFWNRGGTTLGQPVRAFQSQIGIGSERDRLSNEWRRLENRNIALNIESAPLTGLGFGRPYKFYIAEPSLDGTGFVYWNYITHNAVFWVWMKMGVVGFVAFWFLMGSAIVGGLITFRTLSDGYLKALAITAVSLVAMQLFFSYGDLGLTYTRNMIYLGVMLGILVRLPSLDTKAQMAPIRSLAGPRRDGFSAAGARG
jgi:hypothetical protein